MKKSVAIIALAFTGIMVSAFFKYAVSTTEVPYPEGYRNWVHVKTTVTSEQAPARYKGFHHIYANDKALAGLQSGRYANGSIFVFDVIEAVPKNGNITEGNRKLIDVMVKDSKSYDSTGGWGFEEFNDSSKTARMLTQPKTQCFNCHTSREANGFVFSSYPK
jgi:hypothetical protein